jgi:hypothetical protein
MHDITQISIESTLIDSRQSGESDLLDACFYAYIILIDLCDSTRIKQKEPFPKWIYTMESFFEIVENQFQSRNIFPIKYLGDAILYIIPDCEDENSKKYMNTKKINIPELNIKEIIELCINVKNDWWDANEEPRRKQRGIFGREEKVLRTFLSLYWGSATPPLVV